MVKQDYHKPAKPTMGYGKLGKFISARSPASFLCCFGGKSML